MNEVTIINENGKLGSGRSFLQARLPQLKFAQARWATARTENVEQIADQWQKDPSLVKIFQDPKFGHMQMALLRKDQLEALLKIVRDVESGQAAIQYDVRALIDAVGIVQDLVEGKKSSLPDDIEKPLSKAVSLMVNLWGRISSTIFVQAPKREVKPSPLSAEERQPLED